MSVLWLMIGFALECVAVAFLECPWVKFLCCRANP